MQGITRQQDHHFLCLRRTPLMNYIRLRPGDLEVHLPSRIACDPFLGSFHNLLRRSVQVSRFRIGHSPEWRIITVRVPILVLPGIGNDSPVCRIDHEIHKGPVVFLDEIIVDVCAYHPELGVAVALQWDAQAVADAAVGAVGAEKPVCGEDDIVTGGFRFTYHYC